MRKTVHTKAPSANAEGPFPKFAHRLQCALRHRPGQVRLPHKLVKDGVDQALPGRQHQRLKLSHALKKNLIFKTNRLRLQPSPCLCGSGALAGKVSWLPNHIDRAYHGHDKPRYCRQKAFFWFADDQAESSRPADDLQEAKDRTHTAVETAKSLPVLTHVSSLKDEVISIRIYPHLSCHCLILVFPRWNPTSRCPLLAALLASASSNFLLRFRPGGLEQKSVGRLVSKVSLSWSAPCEWFDGVGTNILSQVGLTAHTPIRRPHA